MITKFIMIIIMIMILVLSVKMLSNMTVIFAVSAGKS